MSSTAPPARGALASSNSVSWLLLLLGPKLLAGGSLQTPSTPRAPSASGRCPEGFRDVLFWPRESHPVSGYNCVLVLHKQTLKLEDLGLLAQEQ